MSEKLTEKHPVQFGPILWERLARAAGKESIKQGKTITSAEYVRQIIAKHLKRRSRNVG